MYLVFNLLFANLIADWLSVSSSPVQTKKSNPTMPALVGLQNYGNTCYINSVLQIVHNVDYFSVDGNDKWNNLIRQAYTKQQLKPLISQLSKNKKQFKKNRQGDAQELLLFMLGYIKGSNFQITTSTRIHCHQCKHISKSNNKSNMLFIDPKKTIEMNLLPDSTMLNDYKCEKCKLQGIAKKTDQVHGHPQLLILSINAFKKKINVPLTFNWTTENQYQLIGMIVHLGSDNCGHYIAIVKKDGHWYECNDNRILKLTQEDVLRFKPYVAFYEKINKKKSLKRNRDEVSISESTNSQAKKSKNVQLVAKLTKDTKMLDISTVKLKRNERVHRSDNKLRTSNNQATKKIGTKLETQEDKPRLRTPEKSQHMQTANMSELDDTSQASSTNSSSSWIAKARIAFLDRFKVFSK